ncbi:MAG: 6-bladed beta-propeller [Gemmatimonadota bacterium]
MPAGELIVGGIGAPRTLLGLFLAGLAVGCDAREGPDPDSSGAVVRDSAGITIVENFTPAWGADKAWRLSDEPDLVIGSLDGPAPYTFSAPRPYALSDGRILVAELAQQEIRIFSADGEHLLTAGGKGDGPGEFTRLNDLVVLPGDTILAFDGGHMRFTAFDDAGTLLDMATLDFPTDTWRGRFFGVVDTLRVVGRSFASDDTSGLSRERIEVALHDSSGERRLVVDTLNGRRLLERETPNDLVLSTLLPFEPEGAAVAGNGRIYSTAADRVDVRVHAADGTLERIIRLDRPARPVTDETVRRHMEGVEEQFEQFDTPVEFRAAFREMNERAARSSDVLPMVRDLKVESSGHLLVIPWAARWEATPPALVFDTEGRWLGELEVPDGHAVSSLASDHALATWLDELDISYVGRLPLER